MNNVNIYKKKQIYGTFLPQFMGMVLELLKNAQRHFQLLCALKLLYK